jgi:hypothetical protein
MRPVLVDGDGDERMLNAMTLECEEKKAGNDVDGRMEAGKSVQKCGGGVEYRCAVK